MSTFPVHHELSGRNIPQPHLNPIPWRDLIPVTKWERILELSLPLPWLAASIYLYSHHHLVLGALASFYFFLTGLRVSHGAQHYSLGWPRPVQDWTLFTLSILMLASMHSVQASHLHHHRHCMDPSDAEGETARLPWWRAILVGPLFPLRLHLAAWKLANPRQSKWITAELLSILTIIIAALLFPTALPGLTLHLAVMIIGECFTGFFAVWTVHHHCEDEPLPARTQRGRWITLLTYSMFFHAEHHLYPAVPTCHLSTLAARLDQNSQNSQTGHRNKQVMPELMKHS
jgi:fatty acid desaturase